MSEGVKGFVSELVSNKKKQRLKCYPLKPCIETIHLKKHRMRKKPKKHALRKKSIKSTLNETKRSIKTVGDEWT